MDIIIAIKAALLGIVEGLTEFLPISSTGHLIVAGDLLHWNDSAGKLFEIVIQLAAILAVCWEYRVKLWTVVVALPRESGARRFVANLLIAFLPAAVTGVIFSSAIKQYLFAPIPVALAFIVGAIIILLVDRGARTVRTAEVDAMRWPQALGIGIAQVAALVPGTSRSGATIIGGLLCGLSRRAATEFSFFLAIPVMFAATFYEIVKDRAVLDAHFAGVLGIGCLASFVSAFIAIRALLRFVSHHNFAPFAYYRIVFGLLVLVTWKTGLVAWTE
ncbi:MAG: undecaprenyl-diphosphate phosphatase [Steroidobacteraceae bacterium]